MTNYSDQFTKDLLPELSEEGIKQAQDLSRHFIDKFKMLAKECLYDIHADLTPHIKSDAWDNFRLSIVNALRNYPEAKDVMANAKEIRAAWFEQYRDEVIADINQDHLKEIERLKKRIEDLEALSTYVNLGSR